MNFVPERKLIISQIIYDVMWNVQNVTDDHARLEAIIVHRIKNIQMKKFSRYLFEIKSEQKIIRQFSARNVITQQKRWTKFDVIFILINQTSGIIVANVTFGRARNLVLIYMGHIIYNDMHHMVHMIWTILYGFWTWFRNKVW